MLFLLLPILGILAGVGAALIFRSRSTVAVGAAIIIPITLLNVFATFRVGPEILAHPGLWIQALMWSLFVLAGYLVTRTLARKR